MLLFSACPSMQHLPMDNVQTVKVAKVWLGDDGIARVVHVPDVDLTLADAQETMAAYSRATGGNRCPLFVDTRRMRSMSRESRHYYASAVALLVDTPVSRVLGNFYLGLSNPYLPTRVFTNETDVAWLQGYRA